MSKKPRKYRVRNWSEYNVGLAKRGSITFWIDEESAAGWLNQEKTGKRGASQKYSNLAIETVLSIKAIYKLAGRQAVGFVTSVFELMQLDLDVPDHSTLSRRLSNLTITLPVIPKKGARHIVIDSTGIKIYGEGEWKTRQHGVSKRRTWRKLHLAVDEATGEILAAEVSLNDKKDSQLLDSLLETIDEADETIEQVSADGAYDSKDCYESIRKHKAKAVIPPRKDAKIIHHGNCKQEPHPRDENLRYIRKHTRKKWKRDFHYHRRSIAETTVFRYKTIFDPKASSRTFPNQENEIKLNCKLLNKMSLIAKPDSYLVL